MSTTSRSARAKSTRTTSATTATTSALRQERSTTTPKKVAIVLPSPSKCCSEKDAEIQRLRDGLEEAMHDREQLQARLEQLEERVDYKETSARIAAAILDNEKMELRENVRQLGIQLSSATHERDILRYDKNGLTEQLANCEDERKVLSAQLTDAWRRIPRLKKDYTDVLDRLSITEKEVDQLKKEREKAIEQATAVKTAYDDEKAQWERDKRDLVSEVASLKEELMSSSNDGGKQVLDFEKDIARVRGHHKSDREKWDAEKRRFMDQIASFRVKLTSLSVQQPKTAPPPEWLLEKQTLEDKCADLSSRLAAAEQSTSSKADLDRLTKLEAKNAALKAKLKEVLEHATTVQAEADQFRTKLGKKPSSQGNGRSGGARRGGAAGGGAGRGRGRKAAVSAKSDSESRSDVDTGDENGTASPVLPAPRPARPVRAKRQAAEKKITSALESDSSESEDEDGESESDEEEDSDSEHTNEDNDDKSEGVVEPNTSMDMNEPSNVADDNTTPADTGNTEVLEHNDDKDMEDIQNAQPADLPRPASPSVKGSRSGARTSSGRGTRRAANDSDTEYEPPAKVLKPRGKGRAKATAAKEGGDPESKTTVSAGSKRPNDSDIGTAPSGSNAISPPTPISPFVDTEDSPSANTNSPAESESLSKAATPGGNAQEPSKVKKKRRLLGKGLEDYSSIIQGPKIPGSPSTNNMVGLLPSIAASMTTKNGGGGSSAFSSVRPSASSPLSAGSDGSDKVSSSSNSRKNQANKEALNAIKLAFSVPKARRPSEE